MHVVSFLLVLLKLWTSQKCTGLSLKTQALYFLVFATRYLDLFTNHLSMYNTIMKVIFLAASGLIVYLMKYKKPICNSYDPNMDDFDVKLLVIPCVLIGIMVHLGQVYIYEDPFSVFEIFWCFSIYLEAFAIVPQLAVLRQYAKQNSGFVETLTSHYVFALGSYRVLYMVNWIDRYLTEEDYTSSWVVWIGGIIQTLLYGRFFYFYVTAAMDGTRVTLPV